MSCQVVFNFVDNSRVAIHEKDRRRGVLIFIVDGRILNFVILQISRSNSKLNSSRVDKNKRSKYLKEKERR